MTTGVLGLLEHACHHDQHVGQSVCGIQQRRSGYFSPWPRWLWNVRSVEEPCLSDASRLVSSVYEEVFADKKMCERSFVDESKTWLEHLGLTCVKVIDKS